MLQRPPPLPFSHLYSHLELYKHTAGSDPYSRPSRLDTLTRRSLACLRENGYSGKRAPVPPPCVLTGSCLTRLSNGSCRRTEWWGQLPLERVTVGCPADRLTALCRQRWAELGKSAWCGLPRPVVPESHPHRASLAGPESHPHRRGILLCVRDPLGSRRQQPPT